MIDQSEWRVGLTEPDYIRIENEVHNLIIHHTAGSNTDDNYFQVVRSIYIYHTETRGWSDIGYNYLIAQDGSIFKGRDPGDLEQDNVLGAHFCSSNTGTMGISILGTYTDIAPPDTAIASLIELLNWKAGKDGLDPIGVFPHPLNDELPVIAGHRDGCSTECPGEMLYTLLNEIRENTLNAFLECGFSVNPIPFHSIPGQDVTVTCTDRGLIVKAGSTFEVEVYTLLGQKVAFTEETLAPDEKIIQINRVSPGNLILVVKGKETYYSGMVFIP